MHDTDKQMFSPNLGLRCCFSMKSQRRRFHEDERTSGVVMEIQHPRRLFFFYRHWGFIDLRFWQNNFLFYRSIHDLTSKKSDRHNNELRMIYFPSSLVCEDCDPIKTVRRRPTGIFSASQRASSSTRLLMN